MMAPHVKNPGLNHPFEFSENLEVTEAIMRLLSEILWKPFRRNRG